MTGHTADVLAALLAQALDDEEVVLLPPTIRRVAVRLAELVELVDETGREHGRLGT